MAASDTELFFELTNSVFVQSVDSPNQINPPVFYADDVKPLLLKLIRRTSPQNVEVVDLDGVAIRMAFATPASSPTVITSATGGTVDGDGFIPFSVPFNVAAVQTALGTAVSIQTTLEFRVVTGSSPQRYQIPVTIKQRIITDTLADPTPPDIATTLAEVQSLMVPRNGNDPNYPCSSFTMQDEDDATKLYRVVMRAGEFHIEPLQ